MVKMALSAALFVAAAILPVGAEERVQGPKHRGALLFNPPKLCVWDRDWKLGLIQHAAEQRVFKWIEDHEKILDDIEFPRNPWNTTGNLCWDSVVIITYWDTVKPK